MPDVHIRPAEGADWAEVAGLLQVCALPLDGAQENLSTYLLAVVDSAVVGTAGLEVHAGAALLRSVAVAPSQQGRGIGQALIAGVYEEVRRRGIATLYLLTTTATGYFARLGFSVVARELSPAALQASPEFQGACPDSAALMSRSVAR